MLQNALVSSVKKLQDAKDNGLIIDFAIIGGFAVAAWGYPRATEDIDFAISVNRDRLKEVAAYFKGELKVGDFSDPLIATINFELEKCLIQLIVLPKNWEAIAFEDLQLINLMGTDLPIIGWEQLVLLKLYAGSDMDLYDVKRIIDTREPGQRSLEALKVKSRKLRVSKKFEKALAIKR